MVAWIFKQSILRKRPSKIEEDLVVAYENQIREGLFWEEVQTSNFWKIIYCERFLSYVYSENPRIIKKEP